MIPYKFAPQKKGINVTGAAFGKRLNLDANLNMSVTESTMKRVFDGGFSQSLSSRHVESHSLGGSAYPHLKEEDVDSKPAIFAPVSLSITQFSILCAFLKSLLVSMHLLCSVLSQ